MFKLYDGREHFYQWDIDRQLVIEDKSITSVHFCNRTDDCSLVCDVYEDDGQYLVNVPNILLQTTWDIHVYAYDDKYTKHEDTFKVRARTKPADYVYTETEIATWDGLEMRMDALENSVTTEGVEQAVSKYLEEHPLEIPDDYITENELEGKGYITAIPDEYVTENELSNKGYATEKYVDDAISKIDVGETVDLSNYYTKDEITALGYQTEEQVLALIAEHGGGGGNLPASEEAEF